MSESPLSTLPTTQKRWIWPGAVNGVDGLEFVDDEVPQPNAGEVLVRIHAVSLNFRDLLVARGVYGKTMGSGLTPGCDPAGEVVALGPGDNIKIKIGDRVTVPFFPTDKGGGLSPSILDTTLGASSQGTLMEYKIFDAEWLIRIPDSLTYEEAATFSCAGLTAYNAILGGLRPILPGETVLIQGTGGVSIFGAQIARASGARVILTSSSDEKLAQIQKFVDETINYKTYPEWHERVLSLTDGRGADLILDVGGNDTLGSSLHALAMGGSISIIGGIGGFESHIRLWEVIYKSANVRGITVGTRKQLESLLHLFNLRSIKPVVGKIFQLSELKEALKTLERQDFIGKVVVKVAAST
ncbi:NAD(P)-binding protein [Auriculariales sp. MPI-PUGE-AT-0066]|nr:NAD(P)-binding protein [Auriculariales sp. MPI-PUGE-AT-0066]